jgi:hypothetical protein
MNLFKPLPKRKGHDDEEQPISGWGPSIGDEGEAGEEWHETEGVTHISDTDSDWQPELLSFYKGDDGLPVPTNFICLAGPCKHYAAILVDANVESVEPMKLLRRFCRALATANELMEVSEGSIFACNLYEPVGSFEKIQKWKNHNKKVLEDAERRIMMRSLAESSEE